LAGSVNAVSEVDRAGGAASRAGLLADRIGRLELEERAAVRRGHWATATRLASERAALKEARHRSTARERRRRT
jgi:hypothetical protein